MDPVTFEVAQVPFEIDRLVELVDAANPEKILEIGTWHGGTLERWLRPDRIVVAVDDEHRNERATLELAHGRGAFLACVKGRSQDPDVVAYATEHAPYGLIFIDADHSFDAVDADWHTYRRMLAPGGMVAFHDILPRPEAEYGVDQLWAQIRAHGYPTVEILEGSRPDYCGIGVVWPA